MNSRTKRILLAFLAMTFIGISIAAWGTVRLVSWARELPNRIQVDTRGMSEGFGKVIVSSYREALNRGDVMTQQHILQSFLQLCDTEPAGCEWIRCEFSADIEKLTSSRDTSVASAASHLLARIHDGAQPALQ